MATDAGASSQSSTTRKVLVRIGANSHVVTLESDADVNAAIVGLFWCSSCMWCVQFCHPHERRGVGWTCWPCSGPGNSWPCFLDCSTPRVSIQEHYNTIPHTLYKYQSTYIQALPLLWARHNYYYMYSLLYGPELIKPILYIFSLLLWYEMRCWVQSREGIHISSVSSLLSSQYPLGSLVPWLIFMVWSFSSIGSFLTCFICWWNQ